MKKHVTFLLLILNCLLAKAQWQAINQLSDLNNWSSQPGFIGYYNGAAHAPADGVYGAGFQVVLPQDTRLGTQVIFPTWDDQIYFRRNQAGSWGGWNRVWSTNNLNKNDVDFNCKNLWAFGNVGIGTTTPQANLEIKAADVFDGRTILRVTNNSSDYGRTSIVITGRFQSNNDAWNFGSSARNSIVFAQNESASGQNVGATGDEKFSIQLEGNSKALGFLSKQNGSTPNMVIAQSGNIGIGTINPDARLAVKGKIHAEEVVVDTNVPVPDYVFEKTYYLKPLSEVANYIALHKHLPEVPSASVMEEEGVNLSEMNLKLLKKVEELTLYLIEEHKSNKRLKAELHVINVKLSQLSAKRHHK